MAFSFGSHDPFWPPPQVIKVISACVIETLLSTAAAGIHSRLLRREKGALNHLVVPLTTSPPRLRDLSIVAVNVRQVPRECQTANVLHLWGSSLRRLDLGT